MISVSELRRLEMKLSRAERTIEELCTANTELNAQCMKEAERADTAEETLKTLRRTVSQLAMDMLK